MILLCSQFLYTVRVQHEDEDKLPVSSVLLKDNKSCDDTAERWLCVKKQSVNKNWDTFLSVCAPGADLFFEHHVTGLYRRGASWEVQRKTGDSETFDAVVLTMPVPQILQLQGDVGHGEIHHWVLKYCTQIQYWGTEVHRYSNEVLVLSLSQIIWAWSSL